MSGRIDDHLAGPNLTLAALGPALAALGPAAVALGWEEEAVQVSAETAADLDSHRLGTP
jgi:hypothetical protein